MRLGNALTADEWEKAGHEFEADVQLKWNVRDIAEHRYHQHLLYYYHETVAAYSYAKLGPMAILELQFDESETGKGNPSEIQAKLRPDFTASGKLKAKLREFWSDERHLIIGDDGVPLPLATMKANLKNAGYTIAK